MTVGSGPQFQYSYGLSEVLDPPTPLAADDKEALLTTRDRELEDYLARLHQASFWNFDSTPGAPTLYNDPTKTPNITDVIVSPTSVSRTALYLTDDSTTSGSFALVFAVGDVNVQSGGGGEASLTSFFGRASVNGDDVLIAASSSGVSIEAAGGSDIHLTLTGGGNLYFANLPTSSAGLPAGAIYSVASTGALFKKL